MSPSIFVGNSLYIGQRKRFITRQSIELSTIVSDSFNRADGAMGNADTGQSWAFVGVGGTAAIESNQAKIVAAGGGIANIATATVDSSVVDKQISVIFVDADVGGTSVHLVFRYQDINNMMYVYYATTLSGWYVTKIQGGGGSTVASTAGSFSAGDVITAVLSGNNVKIYRNGALLMNFDNTFLNTSTECGFGCYKRTAYFDDFLVMA